MYIFITLSTITLLAISSNEATSFESNSLVVLKTRPDRSEISFPPLRNLNSEITPTFDNNNKNNIESSEPSSDDASKYTPILDTLKTTLQS